MSASGDTPGDAARAVPAAQSDFIHRAEMGFTHRELLKSLPSAVAPFQIEKRSDLVYRLHHGAQRVVVTLQPETSRPIAAITVPVTAVKLEFFGFSKADFQSFMDRYKRYLHKGGG